MTQTGECGTQAVTKKIDKTESVSSPIGCSEKPVSAMQAKLAIGKFSVFKVNRSVPRKPASFGRTGKPFEELVQIHRKISKGPSREPHNNITTLLDKPACEQSETESVNSTVGCSEKPVSLELSANQLNFNKIKSYLDGCGTYRTFYTEAYGIGVNAGKKAFKKVIIKGARSRSLFVKKYQKRVHREKTVFEKYISSSSGTR